MDDLIDRLTAARPAADIDAGVQRASMGVLRSRAPRTRSTRHAWFGGLCLVGLLGVAGTSSAFAAQAPMPVQHSTAADAPVSVGDPPLDVSFVWDRWPSASPDSTAPAESECVAGFAIRPGHSGRSVRNDASMAAARQYLRSVDLTAVSSSPAYAALVPPASVASADPAVTSLEARTRLVEERAALAQVVTQQLATYVRSVGLDPTAVAVSGTDGCAG